MCLCVCNCVCVRVYGWGTAARACNRSALVTRTAQKPAAHTAQHAPVTLVATSRARLPVPSYPSDTTSTPWGPYTPAPHQPRGKGATHKPGQGTGRPQQGAHRNPSPPKSAPLSFEPAWLCTYAASPPAALQHLRSCARTQPRSHTHTRTHTPPTHPPTHPTTRTRHPPTRPHAAHGPLPAGRRHLEPHQVLQDCRLPPHAAAGRPAAAAAAHAPADASLVLLAAAGPVHGKAPRCPPAAYGARAGKRRPTTSAPCLRPSRQL